MIADKFSLTPKSKYLTLYLYDKFMCNQFWEVYQEFQRNPESPDWKHVSNKLSSYARLRLMSCIQLASKMDCHSTGLAISQVISALKIIDEERDYTPSIIFHSEFKVFKTIEFKIPIVTPLDAIEVLLAVINFHDKQNVYTTAVSILDFTYLQVLIHLI